MQRSYNYSRATMMLMGGGADKLLRLRDMEL